MKKIYSLLMASAIALSANSQLVLTDQFPYNTGNLGVQGSWQQAGSGMDVRIDNTNPLVYPNYTSGTQYAQVSNNATGTDPFKTFNVAVPTDGNLTGYMSFVVRVNSAVATNGSPEYSLALFNTADADRPLRFYIASEPGNTNLIRFGILTGQSTNVNNVAWTNTTFAAGTTHLIVIRYDITNAAGNQDDAYMWVDLASLTSEPAIASANATQLNANEANYGNLLNAVEFFQNGANSPIADFDALRIAFGASSAIAWINLDPAGAPLPVRLTSFNASAEGFSTKLVWNTAEESGITEYIVEKSTDGRNYTAIGSVKAANLKSYSFIDAQSADNSYYRLKMVELDGTYKYSYIVSVKAKFDASLTLSPNPVKSSLMIQHPKANATSHIQIMSATGQLLRDIRLSSNAVISTVDMSGLSNGLYHVIFRNGSDIFSKTVLKQ